MVLLTTFLMPICILCSWESITMRVRAFMVSFLLLEAMGIGVFCALDVIMFYIFFEGMLIPMYLIIGIWGGTRRIYAAYKFFLYTFAGSVLFLLAILYLYLAFGTTSIPELIKHFDGLSLSMFMQRRAAMRTLTFASPRREPWSDRIATHRVAVVAALAALSDWPAS